MTTEITVDWLRNALPRQCPDCEPVSIEVEPNFGGPSLLGRIVRVRLTYAALGCGPSSVIVKYQAQRSDWEAQIYRLLSEAPGLSVPQVYRAYEDGTLIMEDLSPARPLAQTCGCTVQQAQAVLSMLAEVHTRFWGDPRVPPVDPERFASAICVNMEQCWESFRSRYGEMLGDRASDFEWMWRNAMLVAAHRLSEPATLFHGDVHTENLLFRGNGDGKPVLLDWQLAGRGLAANDLSFFLVKSMTAEQRRECEERLLQEYFESLPERVRTGYAFDRFRLDYRACITRSMVSAVMLVGPRFAGRPDQFDLADILAARVIAAVRDHRPVDAIRQMGWV